MASIPLNGTSNCSNPLIDVFIRRKTSGVLVDIAELEWRILDLTGGEPGVQVEPVGLGPTYNMANIAPCPTGDRLSMGRYVMNFVIPSTYNVGSHRIEWRFREDIGGNQFSSTEEFEVLDIPVGSGGAQTYCTVQSIRDEGITTTQASDILVLRRITEASRYIDRVTGRFFSPKINEYFLDGQGTSTLILQEPIIAISEIEISLQGVSFTDQPIDLNDVAIYNRHLAQNLIDPDDRDNPKISFKNTDPEFARLNDLFGRRRFYEGRQNIRVSGVFGYTDNDGTSTGKTPDLICEACRRIVIHKLPLFGDTDATQEIASMSNIRRLKTRDQEIEYQNRKLVGGLTEGPFTGDKQIDDILLMYARPMRISAV